jgi:hypothetical protein
MSTTQAVSLWAGACVMTGWVQRACVRVLCCVVWMCVPDQRERENKEQKKFTRETQR